MPAEHEIDAGTRGVLDPVRTVVHEDGERGPGALTGSGSHPGEHTADVIPRLGVVDADDAHLPPLGAGVAQHRHPQCLQPCAYRVASDVALVVADREERGSGQRPDGVERVGRELHQVDQIPGDEDRIGLERIDPAHNPGKEPGSARPDVDVAHLHEPHWPVELR